MKRSSKDLPMPDQPVPYHYPHPDVDDEISLVELWQILMRHKRLIILTTLFAIVIAVVVAFLMTPVYRAEVLLAPVEQESEGRFSQYADLASIAGINLKGGGKGSKSEVAVAMLQSRAFATSFIQNEQLLPILFAKGWDSKKQRWLVKEGENVPTLWSAYEVFSGILSIKKEKTGLVKLAIEWKNPEQAANWANKLVHRLNGLIKAKDIQQAQRSIEYLNKELAKTSIVEMQQSIYSLIESQIKTIMMANVLEDYVFRVIDPAVVPETKIKPKRKLIVLLGAIAGFMFAVLLAFLINFFQTQQKPIKQNNADG